MKLLQFRFAGTVGAIVTCPLEVVKTRLQSSSSRFYPSPVLDVGNNKTSTNGTQFKGTSHKRDICTSILQKRSQVINIETRIRGLLYLYTISTLLCLCHHVILKQNQRTFLISFRFICTDFNYITLWDVIKLTVD